MTKLIYLGTSEDEKNLYALKSCIPVGVSVSPICKPIDTLTQIELLAKSRGITGVIVSQQGVLERLLGWSDTRKKPSLDAYQGSLFKRNGLEYVIINPLDQLHSVPYGKFIATRFISKVATPDKWIPSSAFKWNLVDGGNVEASYADVSKAYAVSLDIETFSSPLSIRCLGYTTINLGSDGTISTHSYVLPLDCTFNLVWARKICDTAAPKIFQNGKYDNAYLSMFRILVRNWLWDTATLMHSYYAELPKDLSFLNSFFVRDSMYWKDLADTDDLMEYYRYNALDTWATANVWIAQMLELPHWARKNYLMEFPVNFPAHMCEMRGIKRDISRLVEARKEVQGSLFAQQKAIEVMSHTPGFNCNSYVQVRKLLKALTGREWVESDEKALKKASLMHPLNERLMGAILTVRGDRKLLSTYLRTDEDITKTSPGGAKEYRGRILYALNPHGTDTGRLASRESHFWCGLQIQNVPAKDGPTVKNTFVADDGFYYGEVDLEQAESRDTAYAAGELSLIEAVESPRDFHSVNASAFFGVPYDSIYDDSTKKTKDKKLRDIAKRVNHGANYLMGENVLIDTMGQDKIREAQRLLGLDRSWSLNQVAGYLLSRFHGTYPRLQGIYYPHVANTVDKTHMLTGPQGWTRWCFGNPLKNKRDLNALVAHVAQSMNAMTLNEAFMKVFYEIQMHPQYSMHFKLNAQIHDSILFQFREGHAYLADMVKERMEIPVTVKGADGVTRTFTVPAAIKAGKNGKSAKYWSETE